MFSCRYDNVMVNGPLFITEPRSALASRFILSTAICRSRSVRKDVDSGRLGRKKYVITPSNTGGTPCFNGLNLIMRSSKVTL
jgi:hypothetical protein